MDKELIEKEITVLLELEGPTIESVGNLAKKIADLVDELHRDSDCFWNSSSRCW